MASNAPTTSKTRTSNPSRKRKARKKKVSPMMQQYLAVKAEYDDAILFFRVGDFYEMFLDDAVVAARELDIVLTSRDKDSDDPIPFCGVPHHAAKGYVQRLIDKGFKVAICDQVEDARKAKGIVKREVVRVVTPGLVLDEEGLDARAPAYLLAVAKTKSGWGIASLDVTTGEFLATEVGSEREAAAELERVAPREILVPEGGAADAVLKQAVHEARACTRRPDNHFQTRRATDTLTDQLGVATLDGQGISEMPAAVAAAGAVIEYAREAAKSVLEHVGRVTPYHRNDVLVLDEATRRNLELFESAMGGRKGSLLGVLDRTSTPMGGRLLRAWLSAPLRRPEAVNPRLEAVAWLKDDRLRRSDLRELLAGVSDLERIVGRAATGLASPRDLGSLCEGLGRLPRLRELLADAEGLLAEVRARIDDCPEITEEISAALVDEPPAKLSDGNFIRLGYDDTLDEVLTISRDGKSFIARMEARERERTGISSLKVRYNKVFGYYIEVTKANLDKVPDDYQRKQTTATAERYFTEELKELEDKILNAQERQTELELKLFDRLRKQVAAQSRRIQAAAAAVAELDVLTNLAEIADRFDYVRPDVHDGYDVAITGGRHPVVERMDLGERFVPNDVELAEDRRLLLITGPNMAGKSTVMRQTALIVLMAQIGSFVPASEARIGAVDRIFTRVGASDLLARGQSTFMVEMSETANILNNATRDSLVIVDEIGRGTSTFDGVSIAWAVAEDLHDRVGAKTLFATHYHELTDLPEIKSGAANVSVAVKEWNDQIIFLRKLAPGATSRSYGIQVARLAGLPDDVLDRAFEVLGNLEAGEHDALGTPRLARGGTSDLPRNQLNLFGGGAADEQVADELRALDVDELSPRQALELLYELKKRVKS